MLQRDCYWSSWRKEVGKHVEDGHVAYRPPWSFSVWGWGTREQQGGCPELSWGGSEDWDMGGGS